MDERQGLLLFLWLARSHKLSPMQPSPMAETSRFSLPSFRFFNLGP